jgi:hypothetical protein
MATRYPARPTLLLRWHVVALVGCAVTLGVAANRVLASQAAAGSPSAGAPATAWFCPMHPDVTSDAAGRCRRCGMAFIQGNPFDVRDYRLDVVASPAAIVPGRPFRLTLRVTHPDTGDVIKSFETVHDKRYHLFVVGHDLESFQHLHPDLQPDGTWAMDVTVPKAGYYRVLSDFVPTGGAPQFLGRTLVTAGFDGDIESQEASLSADAVFSKTVGSITANLTFEPRILTAGEYGHLQFELADVRTGQPVTDLEPYLGAFGHTLILSEDLLDSVHSHPTDWLEGGVATGHGGPRVTFEGYMPRPGRYRSWTQFLRGGELTTVSFTFEVRTLEDAVRLGRRASAQAGAPRLLAAHVAR